MVDTRLHIDTGIDLSGVPGALPILGPWPKLDGRLFAAYMFGTGYAQWARVPDAVAKGTLLDWSGNGRHIASMTELTPLVGTYGVTCLPMNNEPALPFLLADVWAANSAFSLVALVKSAVTARTVGIIRSNQDIDLVTSTSLTLLPSAGDVRIAATTASVAVNANITDAVAELPNISLYGGPVNTTTRTVWAKTGTSPTKEATVSGATGAVSSVANFEFGDEGGAGSGNTIIYGFAIYNNMITKAEFESILIRQRNFHTAIGSGVPV